MGGFESYKDGLAMVVLQCIYAGFALFARASFDDGLNPQVFIVYRQALATLVIAPLALFSMKKSGSSLLLSSKAFGLIFLAALFGITGNQSTYLEGISLSSATVAAAIVNLNVAITFLMAVMIGVEKVNVRSLRGASKILGTIVCMAGAVAVSLLKGPTLVNTTVEAWMRSVLGLESNSWLIGCVLVFISCWFWSAWLVLQVHINKHCPNQLYSTFLTTLLGLVQTTVLAMILERDIQDWKLDTVLEYVACIYSGAGSTVTYFGQAWVISRRGPVFFATFNPLRTVVVAIIGCIFLDETIYLGSLVGALTIIIGLYMVLWGKANDNKKSLIDLEELLLPSDDLSTLEEDSHSLLPQSPYEKPHPLSPFTSFG